MAEHDDEMVFLTLENSDDLDGELRLRSQLPNDALRAGFDIDGTNLEGGEPRMYPVYTVDR